ncbi:RNA polymerase sigma factor, sigma-70 family precursor [Sphingobium yanoikuyae]|jgi:RNA polymerase sigma factor (sigma-70 family)|uniref:RNA polymerase sigma factor, sigma-70 family n=1 Tax=Sphingobium yanoikuyae TaxID=13690 RepID=A0A084EEQ0_SPHYA|nr:sigma-70 family RNA polymerase sigma factor [Sphingobium yanoikuyae]KEZ16442.1 RNA polymerase sigma factor, sigma-70 family precursor [Sphingobium yanoikuyae]QJR05834.1 sigma-70 family RNA polymerase sigma factor [Sphingobium yanoikuyae]
MKDDISASTQAPRLSDAEFKAQLAAVLPQLRAFARSLAGNRDTADDLVQETMLKAWRARERYVAGTNFRAWAFVILRNHFLSEMRRKRFVGEWDELVADRVLAAPADQEKSVELRDMMRALMQLPVPQREALILVGAGGISYEETAEIVGVAVGTIKSRVARARVALEQLLDGGNLENNRAEVSTQDNVVVSIFDYLESIRAQHGLAAKPFDISQLAKAA